MIRDVLQTTGITATAGIGTNLYLSKIAMDIVAKHIEPNKDGVRIADWMKCLTGSFYGITDRLQISGGSGAAMQRSLQKMDCIQWAILQDVP